MVRWGTESVVVVARSTIRWSSSIRDWFRYMAQICTGNTCPCRFYVSAAVNKLWLVLRSICCRLLLDALEINKSLVSIRYWLVAFVSSSCRRSFSSFPGFAVWCVGLSEVSSRLHVVVVGLLRDGWLGNKMRGFTIPLGSRIWWQNRLISIKVISLEWRYYLFGVRILHEHDYVLLFSSAVVVVECVQLPPSYN